MQRYAWTYFILLGILFAVETLPAIQDFTVGTWTQFLADLSGNLMQIFDSSVVVEGSNLKNRETGFAVSIKAGCNGVEAAMILAAAILAYPSGWAKKGLGMVVGVIAIQCLNLLRIISLFYLGEWNQELLNVAHLYVWPGLIILDALIIFLVWLHWQKPVDPMAGLL